MYVSASFLLTIEEAKLLKLLKSIRYKKKKMIIVINYLKKKTILFNLLNTIFVLHNNTSYCKNCINVYNVY